MIVLAMPKRLIKYEVIVMIREQLGSPMKIFLRVLQGALIGLGAVLPGISGGVLCVVFGFYTVIMDSLPIPSVSSSRTASCWRPCW